MNRKFLKPLFAVMGLLFVLSGCIGWSSEPVAEPSTGLPTATRQTIPVVTATALPTPAPTHTQVPTPVPPPEATETAVPPTLEPTSETGDTLGEWQSYSNATYGFSFRYPPQWSLIEADNLLILEHEPLRMGIAFQYPGEELDPPWTGMPAGELNDVEAVPFWTGPIRKQVLVYQGKVKAVFYGPAEGDLFLEMRLDDGSADFEAIDIPPDILDLVDEIIGSFTALDPTAAATASGAQDGAGEGNIGQLPPRCLDETLGDSLFVNPVDGYCLRYPAIFELGDVYPPGIANLYGPPYDCSLQPVRAAVTLRVVDVVGEQSLDMAAAQFLARQGSEALGDGTVTEVDGHEGLVVEAQGDFSRSIYLFALHDGKLFAFSFYPQDEAFAQARPDLDELWNSIMNSLAFLPPETAAALLESGAYAPEPTPTARPYVQTTPGRPQPSFEYAVYRDEETGFEFDYPAQWILGDEVDEEAQMRIRHLAAPPPDPAHLNVAITLWQPDDLDSYAALREQSWREAGMTIHSRQEWRLGSAGELRAYCYLVEAEPSRTMFLIAEKGEQYIVLSGTGDLDQMTEIARGLRPLDR